MILGRGSRVDEILKGKYFLSAELVFSEAYVRIAAEDSRLQGWN
jgi:hypothetical protein